MKRTALALALFTLVQINSNAEFLNTNTETTVTTNVQQRKVVFRTTQKLRASNGRELYLYTSGRAEWYGSNGKLLGEYTYTLIDGEIFLYRDGEREGKGSYTMKRDRLNLASVKLNGVIYYKK